MEEEEPVVTTMQTQFFLQDLFHKLLPKVFHILHLTCEPKGTEEPEPTYPYDSSRALPKASASLGVPFPAVFNQVVNMERKAPAKLKANHNMVSKFYSFVPEAAKRFRLPLVENTVLSLCSMSVLPMEVDGFPRDSCDKHIEQALCKYFEASLAVVWASTSGSLF